MHPPTANAIKYELVLAAVQRTIDKAAAKDRLALAEKRKIRAIPLLLLLHAANLTMPQCLAALKICEDPAYNDRSLADLIEMAVQFVTPLRRRNNAPHRTQNGPCTLLPALHTYR